MELNCIIHGPLNRHMADLEILIHHMDHDAVPINCTTFESKETPHVTVCTTTISPCSLSDSGKYFCAVVVDEKYFPSKVRDVDIHNDSKRKLIIIAGSATGGAVLLLLVIIVSIVGFIKIGRRAQIYHGGNGRNHGGGNNGNNHGNGNNGNNHGNGNNGGDGNDHDNGNDREPLMFEGNY